MGGLVSTSSLMRNFRIGPVRGRYPRRSNLPTESSLRNAVLTAAPVVESLRVDEECFAELTGEMFDEVLSAYDPGRISRFLKGLREDLKL